MLPLANYYISIKYTYQTHISIIMQYPHASHCEISTNHRPSLNRLSENFDQSQAVSQPPIGKFQPITGQLSTPHWKISTNDRPAFEPPLENFDQ